MSATLDEATFDAHLETPGPVIAEATPDARPDPAPAEPDAASDAGKVLARRSAESRSAKIHAEIAKATWERHEAERATAAARAEFARIQDATNKIAAPPEPEVDEANFTDYKDVVKAVARREYAHLEAERQTREAEASRATEAARTAADQARASRVVAEAYTTSLETYVADHPELPDLIAKASDPHDIEQWRLGEPVSAAHAPVSFAMKDAILLSAHGPQLTEYLALHPDEAQVMAKLPPLESFAAIVRLETRLDAAPSGSAPPRRSHAPPPIKPVAGVHLGGDPLEVTADTPFEEFVRRENLRDQKAGRR